VATLLPTVHPANVLRNGKPITDIIAADLGKALRISQAGRQLDEHIIYVVPGYPLGIEVAFHAAIEWMRYWRATGATLGVDIETSGIEYFNCKFFSIALGDAATGVAVAFTLKDLRTLPQEYETALDDELRLLLAEPSVTQVYHNSPFDKAVLQRIGYNILGRTIDTMSQAHLIQPDVGYKDLGWVCHTYLDVEPWKLDHNSNKMANTKDPVELLIYNAKDALYTAMVAPLQRDDIHARGMTDELIGWQTAAADLATDMELYGLPLDFEWRKARALEMREELSYLHHELREFLGWADFNPMSDEHRRVALFGDKYAGTPWNLGLASTQKTKKTGRPSTGYKGLIDHFEHPFVNNLARYIETRQTYAKEYRDGTLPILGKAKGLEKPGGYQRAICEDGRLHAKWNTVGTTGSRFSSSPNVQNQHGDPNNPKRNDRWMFRAPEGRMFVGADKDQVELRIMACIAGVPELLEEMARPDGDPHRLAARNVYGEGFLSRTPKEQKNLRNIVKNVVYASIYMAGVQTVWRTIRERKLIDPQLRAAMTLPVVRHVHQSYFGRYYQIPAFHEANMRLIREQGYLEIPPFGRRRYYPVQPPPITEVANWPDQCRAGDYVLMEMILIQEELKKKYKGRASCNVHAHDQVVVECDERDAEDVRDLINKIFGCSRLDGPAGPVNLTATASIGKTLAEVK